MDDAGKSPLERELAEAYRAELARLENPEAELKALTIQPSCCPTCGRRLKRGDLVKGKRLVHLERVK